MFTEAWHWSRELPEGNIVAVAAFGLEVYVMALVLGRGLGLSLWILVFGCMYLLCLTDWLRLTFKPVDVILQSGHGSFCLCSSVLSLHTLSHNCYIHHRPVGRGACVGCVCTPK